MLTEILATTFDTKKLVTVDNIFMQCNICMLLVKDAIILILD